MRNMQLWRLWLAKHDVSSGDMMIWIWIFWSVSSALPGLFQLPTLIGRNAWDAVYKGAGDPTGTEWERVLWWTQMWVWTQGFNGSISVMTFLWLFYTSHFFTSACKPLQGNLSVNTVACQHIRISHTLFFHLH